MAAAFLLGGCFPNVAGGGSSAGGRAFLIWQLLSYLAGAFLMWQVVALLREGVLYVANAGDSRATLFRGRVGLRLTVDHKPEDEGERMRVGYH